MENTERRKLEGGERRVNIWMVEHLQTEAVVPILLFSLF